MNSQSVLFEVLIENKYKTAWVAVAAVTAANKTKQKYRKYYMPNNTSNVQEKPMKNTVEMMMCL